jgi:hypothetical protein
VISCSLVHMYERAKGICYLDLQSSALKMEAAFSSEPLVAIYQTTRCHMPEEFNPDSHRLAKLRSLFGKICDMTSYALVQWYSTWGTRTPEGTLSHLRGYIKSHQRVRTTLINNS